MAGATFKEGNYALRKFKSDFMMTITITATVITLIPLFLILGYLLFKGATSLNWAFFTHMPAPVGEQGGGMANAIVGTFLVVGIACLIGVPIGIGAGLFLAEHRNHRLAGAVDPRGHLRLCRDRPSDGPFFDARRVVRPCDNYGSAGHPHHGRDDHPGAARTA